MMPLPLLAVVVALVVQDQTPLRAAAHDDAPRQTTLSPGDWLEVRGERQGYLAGLRPPARAPGLRAARRRCAATRSTRRRRRSSRAIVDFLRDAPGQESLGIGYAALYLRAAPAQRGRRRACFDALGDDGRAARRGARRRACAKAGRRDAGGADRGGRELRRARSRSFEQRGAHARLLRRRGVPARAGARRRPAAARARAALGLTDPRVRRPARGPTAALDAGEVAGERARRRSTSARAAARRRPADVQRAPPAAAIGDAGGARVLRGARRATRRSPGRRARRRSASSQLVDRSELADEDRLAYDEAALRVGDRAVGRRAGVAGARSVRARRRARRGRARPDVRAPAPSRRSAAGGALRALHLRVRVAVVGARRAARRRGRDGRAAAASGGASCSCFVRREHGWTADSMTPAAIDPELGYVELAGFSPDGTRLLVVREARASGPLGSPHTLAPWIEKRFQVLAVDGLRVEKQSSSLAGFPTFKRWQSPEWARATLANR